MKINTMYKKIIYSTIGFLIGIAFLPQTFNNPKSTIKPTVLGIETGSNQEQIFQSPEISINLSPPVLTAKSALVFDLESDTILFSQNFDQRLPIASLTKLMTALVVIDQRQLSDEVKISASDTKVVGSAMGIKTGEIYSVKDLLQGMLVSSSNDAALALARNVGGLKENFVTLMNDKAQDLKMLDTNFTNPVGWDINDNYSTCLDLKKLVVEVLKHEELKKIFRIKEVSVLSKGGESQHKLVTTNKLLLTNSNIVGIKTGYTTKALGNLIVDSEVSGTNVIAIILNSSDREGDAEKILEWVYSVYRW
jgi:D-alanyl-D-alanine carboxypeptidase